MRPYTAAAAAKRRAAESGADPDDVDRVAALVFEQELLGLDEGV